MGRKASGSELLEQAKACLTKAKTVEELRQAQAVVLPLQFGLSRVATAQAVGLSVGWACQLRRRFVRAGGVLGGGLAKKGGRRHENMRRDEEAAFLAPFFEKAKVGGILIVGEIKQALDVRLDRKVALASAYTYCIAIGGVSLRQTSGIPRRMLLCKTSGEKTPRPSRRNRRPVARRRPPPTDVSGRSAFRENLGYPALWVPQADPAALPGQGHAGIHLRLCGCLGLRRPTGLPDPAPRQRQLHADIPRRGGFTTSE